MASILALEGGGCLLSVGYNAGCEALHCAAAVQDVVFEFDVFRCQFRAGGSVRLSHAARLIPKDLNSALSVSACPVRKTAMRAADRRCSLPLLVDG